MTRILPRHSAHKFLKSAKVHAGVCLRTERPAAGQSFGYPIDDWVPVDRVIIISNKKKPPKSLFNAYVRCPDVNGLCSKSANDNAGLLA